MFVNPFGYLDYQYKLFLVSINIGRTKIVFGFIIQSNFNSEISAIKFKKMWAKRPQLRVKMNINFFKVFLR